MQYRELEFMPAPASPKRESAAVAAQHGLAAASGVALPADREAHADLLRRLPAAARLARRQAVTGLQRSYGNRYTQHVIARALEAPGAETSLDPAVTAAIA